MPTSFQDLQREDARRVFLSASAFAETVTYYPEGHESDPRTLQAVVRRGVPEPTGVDGGRTLQVEATVLIGMDPLGTVDEADPAAWGLATVEIGSDLVEFPDRIGQDPVRWRVVEIIDQSPGLWLLGVAQ